MNYQETLEYLFVKTPAFQQKGETAYKPGLANVMELDDFYGNPHKRFKTIHIAGTNGKGSVSHTLAAILQSAGYKVGLYTSPHLKDFSERIRINGKPISEQYVIDFVREAEEIIDRLNPSFFEITTLMAFTYFAHENVDIAVIETGLGGRLDSTNIISPILSVVTNVSFDHVNLLGDTLEKIAFEKAGIIKKGIPAVVGEMPLGLRPIFTEKTEKVVFAEDTANSDYEFELKGYCQEKNKKTILCAVELLKNELNIKEENIAEGLKNVVELTSLMGRWQKLSSSPLIIADTGHNVARVWRDSMTEEEYEAKCTKALFLAGLTDREGCTDVYEKERIAREQLLNYVFNLLPKTEREVLKANRHNVTQMDKVIELARKFAA